MSLFALLVQLLFVADFSFVCSHYDNPSDYDLYGVKIDIAQQMIIVARNDYNVFSVTFFNSTALTQTCNISYYNSSMYVFSVAIIPGTLQQFIAIGEDMLSVYQFAAIITSDCSSLSPYVDIQYFDANYETHEEYYLMAVDPQGEFAYGFANNFMFIYQMQSPYTFTLLAWTAYSNTLVPRAVDIDSENNCLLLGYDNIYGAYFVSTIFLLKLYPLIGVMNQTDVMRFVDSWIFSQVLNTWTMEYDISVRVNSDEQVALVGIPFLQNIMLISYNTSRLGILKNYPAGSGSG
jgi:hypothetical protein